MKAAILNTYAKNYSTGKIAYGLCEFLREQGDEVLLAYGQGSRYKEEGLYYIGSQLESKAHILFSRLTGFPGCFSTFATRRLIERLKNFSPDVVFLFNLHGYYLNEYLLLDYLKSGDITTIYIMLDEYPFMGKCGFHMECEGYKTGCSGCSFKERYPSSYIFNTSAIMAKKKKKAYENFSKLTFVAIPYTLSLASHSYLLKDKAMYAADEAIDITKYYPREVDKLKERLSIKRGQKVIVCIAVYPNERKGAQYFLEAARKLEENKEVVFVHVGFNGNIAECPSNYIPIGYVNDQDELCEYYSLGDLFCFTSLNETLPSTCLEALACGSPLLLFNVSGMPFIADELHSTLVKPRDVDALVNEIVVAPFKNNQLIESCRNYAVKRYNNKKYYETLRNLAIGNVQETVHGNDSL